MNPKPINKSMSSNPDSICLINESNQIHLFIKHINFFKLNLFNSLLIESNKRILTQITTPKCSPAHALILLKNL